MVRISSTLFKTRKYLRAGFRDSLTVYVQGGAGGNGLPKFGGVGGKGGDVIAVAKDNITLDKVYRSNRGKHYIAKNGQHASQNYILGPPGEDVKFDVPIGVSIVTELGKKLGELNEVNQELIIAKGGYGGYAKNGFLGIKGQAYPVHLHLKLIADIGLVGFPNAGKSTLLNVLSHAKPKIASYPFTTVKPHVGIIKYKDLRQISMADLPGLIEGAHANRGMGHAFLKHIERTKLLLMIVDINGFQLSPMYPHRSCLETVLLLIKELELYNEELLHKPSMILVNKMDTEGASEKFADIRDKLKNLNDTLKEFPEDLRPSKTLKFCDILPVSIRDNPGDVDMLKQKLRILLDVLHELENTGEDVDSDISLERMAERGPKLI